MPIVSAFFGIVIRMFYKDHNPPHVHAEYQGQKAVFDFNGIVTAGEITSNTANKLIKEWISSRQNELFENWSKLGTDEQIDQIPPLE